MRKMNQAKWLFWIVVAVFLPDGGRMQADAESPEAVRFAGIRLQPCAWNGKTTFVDARDGREYRQVEIGGRCWMATNLSFGKLVPDMTQTDNHIPECTCHQNDPKQCEPWGAYYSWDEAMDYAQPQAGETIQGLCPDGWHLPSDAEWTAMEQSLDPSIAGSSKDWRGKTLAHQLIAADPAWQPAAQPNNPSGFEALPAGSAVSGWFFYLGRGAYFWTSTPYSAAAAWSRGLLSQTAQVFRGPGDKMTGYSVRCIKTE